MNYYELLEQNTEDAEIQFQLYLACLNGEGGGETEAKEWLEQAAENGYEEAIKTVNLNVATKQDAITDNIANVSLLELLENKGEDYYYTKAVYRKFELDKSQRIEVLESLCEFDESTVEDFEDLIYSYLDYGCFNEEKFKTACDNAIELGSLQAKRFLLNHYSENLFTNNDDVVLLNCFNLSNQVAEKGDFLDAFCHYVLLYIIYNNVKDINLYRKAWKQELLNNSEISNYPVFSKLIEYIYMSESNESITHSIYEYAVSSDISNKEAFVLFLVLLCVDCNCYKLFKLISKKVLDSDEKIFQYGLMIRHFEKRTHPASGIDYYSNTRPYFGKWNNCLSKNDLLGITEYIKLKNQATSGDVEAMLDIASGFLCDELLLNDNQLINMPNVYNASTKAQYNQKYAYDARYYYWIMKATQRACECDAKGIFYSKQYITTALLEALKIVLYCCKSVFFSFSHMDDKGEYCYFDQYEKAKEMFETDTYWNYDYDKLFELFLKLSDNGKDFTFVSPIHNENNLDRVKYLIYCRNAFKYDEEASDNTIVDSSWAISSGDVGLICDTELLKKYSDDEINMKNYSFVVNSINEHRKELRRRSLEEAKQRRKEAERRAKKAAIREGWFRKSRICPNCNALNSGDAKLCKGCGLSFTQSLIKVFYNTDIRNVKDWLIRNSNKIIITSINGELNKTLTPGTIYTWNLTIGFVFFDNESKYTTREFISPKFNLFNNYSQKYKNTTIDTNGLYNCEVLINMIRERSSSLGLENDVVGFAICKYEDAEE